MSETMNDATRPDPATDPDFAEVAPAALPIDPKHAAAVAVTSAIEQACRGMNNGDAIEVIGLAVAGWLHTGTLSAPLTRFSAFGRMTEAMGIGMTTFAAADAMEGARASGGPIPPDVMQVYGLSPDDADALRAQWATEAMQAAPEAQPSAAASAGSSATLS